MTMLSAHKMLGETLSGLILIGVIVALFARNPQGGARRATVVFLRLFAIVISIQWLIGLVNFIVLMRQGASPGWMHPILMTVVLGIAHMVSGRVRNEPDFGYGPTVVATLVIGLVIMLGIGRLGLNVF